MQESAPHQRRSACSPYTREPTNDACPPSLEHSLNWPYIPASGIAAGRGAAQHSAHVVRASYYRGARSRSPAQGICCTRLSPPAGCCACGLLLPSPHLAFHLGRVLGAHRHICINPPPDVRKVLQGCARRQACNGLGLPPLNLGLAVPKPGACLP